MSDVLVRAQLPSQRAWQQTLSELCRDGVASRVSSADLRWYQAPEKAIEIVDQATALRADLARDGMDRVLLIGMGGCGTSAALLAAAAGTQLTVLNTPDPARVRSVLADLAHTTVIVASKSGRTETTNALAQAAVAALRSQGGDPARQLVAITDLGSPLAVAAGNYRAVFDTPPGIVGHFAAFTAFGIVPAVLGGGNLGRLLPEAIRTSRSLRGDWPGNPALQIAACWELALAAGITTIAMTDNDPALPGLADWLEHLLAASLQQLLPVVTEDASAAGFAAAAPDVALLTLGEDTGIVPASGFALTVDGPLGSLLLTFEYAMVALALRLGIDPFRTVACTELRAEPTAPECAKPYLVGAQHTPEQLAPLLAQFLRQLPANGYLAIYAYLNPAKDNAARLRALSAARTDRPVTFGWAPALTHTTGNLHRHGPATGAYLIVTAEEPDLPVPGTKHTFAQMQWAQARRDTAVLAGRGCPVLRLHLADRACGLDTITRALLRIPTREREYRPGE